MELAEPDAPSVPVKGVHTDHLGVHVLSRKARPLRLPDSRKQLERQRLDNDLQTARPVAGGQFRLLQLARDPFLRYEGSRAVHSVVGPPYPHDRTLTVPVRQSTNATASMMEIVKKARSRDSSSSRDKPRAIRATVSRLTPGSICQLKRFRRTVPCLPIG